MGEIWMHDSFVDSGRLALLHLRAVKMRMVRCQLTPN